MSAAASRPRVLFVDDEKRVLNSMRALFRRDYELFLTTLGSEAIQIAEEQSVDVIIADQRMPEMSGVEVLGQVKQRSPGTVRILLTGYADLDAIEGSINIGEVFRFLSKPCPPQELRETLAEAVQVARQSAQAAAVAARAEAGSGAQQPADTAKPVPAKEKPPAVAAEKPEPAAPEPVVQKPATTEPAAERPAAAARVVEQPAPKPAVAESAAQKPSSPAADMPAGKPGSPAPDTPAGKPTPAPATAGNAATRPQRENARPRPAPARKKPVPAADPLSAADQALGASFEDHVATVPNLALELDRELADEGTMETEIIMSGDTNMEFVNTIVIEDGVRTVTRSSCDDMEKVGVALFTADNDFAASVERVLQDRYAIARASTLVEVTELLAESRAGVLVTDFCADGAMLRNMISTLKRYLPELITIVISNERDAAEMISLINHGQVFRYMSKPMDEGRLVQNVNAGVLRHIQLRQNPELVQRHSVVPDRPPRQGAAILAQFVGRIKEMRRFWVRT